MDGYDSSKEEQRMIDVDMAIRDIFAAISAIENASSYVGAYVKSNRALIEDASDRLNMLLFEKVRYSA